MESPVVKPAITSPFGGEVGGSTPPGRAVGEGVRGSLSRVADPPRQLRSGEARPTGYVGSASEVAPEKPGPHYLNCLLPSPCRLCGGPTWLQDELGSIHPCCELWKRSGGSVDSDGLLVCPGCRASEKLNREQRRRHG